MLIHSFLPSSRVNGPGNRAVVWFRGCKLSCPGCWNKETHSFYGGESVDCLGLADRILNDDVNGVTFSGGEPMHQAVHLAGLMLILKYRRPDFSIGMYTGYTLRELNRGEYFLPKRISEHGKGEWRRPMKIGWWEAIRNKLDFAVMGRYNQEQPCDLPLRSSRNQVLELFSGRHTEADFTPQQVEFNISSDVIEITGFPTKDIYANL